MRGSFTVEAVFIVPMVLFVLMFGLKTGIDFHQQTCMAVETIDEAEEMEAVKLFWKAERLNQVKDLLLPSLEKGDTE